MKMSSYKRKMDDLQSRIEVLKNDSVNESAIKLFEVYK